MPKMSVYVTDELWNRVKAANPESGASEAVQEALQEHLERLTARPAYAQLDEKLKGELALTQTYVARRVTEVYRLGYALGLDLCDEIPGPAFAALEALNWDIEAWNTASQEEDWELEEPGRYFSVKEALERLAADHNLPALPTSPSGVVGEGFRDALRDVWEGALRAGPTPRGPAAPTAGADEPPAQPLATAVAPSKSRKRATPLESPTKPVLLPFRKEPPDEKA
jgi:hypothetical protein